MAAAAQAGGHTRSASRQSACQAPSSPLSLLVHSARTPLALLKTAPGTSSPGCTSSCAQRVCDCGKRAFALMTSLLAGSATGSAAASSTAASSATLAIRERRRAVQARPHPCLPMLAAPACAGRASAPATPWQALRPLHSACSASIRLHAPRSWQAGIGPARARKAAVGSCTVLR